MSGETTDEPQDSYTLFVQQWTMEDMPACPEGMVLLLAFAEKYPTLFELAAKFRFVDPPTPAVKLNRMWLAFADHCSHCGDCNEAD